ncbi:MAG TPA: pitrilysin family protein [Nitrolancea sp.]|nr:pitrilysin family protein [Nitrolancea sp.]
MAERQPVRRTVLDNGLTILTRESRRVPVASFFIWYRVGARNEVPGVTGVSHWVEHMLFKGTERWQPGEIFRAVNKYGGTLNGFTWLDYTAYYETLPSANLLLGADIESDRMMNALFDPEQVASERTVILSERQGNENRPTFRLSEELNAAAFRAHPYGQGVIGFKSDLESMTRDDLYQHYRMFYAPNNATVVVVGDFETTELLREIEQRFGKAEPIAQIPAVRTIEPEQVGQRRVTVRRPAPAATMIAGWHAPAASSPDAPAMVVLDTVLSGGKSIGAGGGGGMGRSSRLYRALVASGLTSSAGSSFALTIDPYLFSVSATLLPATAPEQVESIVFEQVERLREELVPADELNRAIKQVRAQLAYAGESVTSQAYWIGSLETVAPGNDADEFNERIASVTAEDIQRVAQTYLLYDHSNVGWLEPTEASGGAPVETGIASYRPHFFTGTPAAEPPDNIPHIELKERTLPNGIRLLGHYDPTSDAAVFDIRLSAGSIADGSLPGLASFTSRMLSRGSSGRTFAELNEELDSLGAAISAGAGREYADVTGKSLKEDAPRLVELIADLLRHPTFPDDELERVREQSLNGLKQALNDTRAVASQALREMIYPEGHPYRHRSLGTDESLRAITRDELLRFHREHFRPDQMIVAVAGGLEVEAAWKLIEDALGNWQVDGPAPEIAIPDVEPLPTVERHDSTVPGKIQADIALGVPSLSRADPDYEALRMANMILGRLGMMGRLGASVRERQGMAYYASSSLGSGLGRGIWSAYAGVDPDNIERAIDSMIEEIDRLRAEPVTEDELADAKSFLIGSLPLGMESSDSIADSALDIAFYNLGIDYVDLLPARIRALTAADLQAAAQRYLLTDHLAITVAKPDGQ